MYAIPGKAFFCISHITNIRMSLQIVVLCVCVCFFYEKEKHRIKHETHNSIKLKYCYINSSEDIKVLSYQVK
jgi:uncharacterized membrane protein YkgB